MTFSGEMPSNTLDTSSSGAAVGIWTRAGVSTAVGTLTGAGVPTAAGALTGAPGLRTLNASYNILATLPDTRNMPSLEVRFQLLRFFWLGKLTL